MSQGLTDVVRTGVFELECNKDVDLSMFIDSHISTMFNTLSLCFPKVTCILDTVPRSIARRIVLQEIRQHIESNGFKFYGTEKLDVSSVIEDIIEMNRD